MTSCDPLPAAPVVKPMGGQRTFPSSAAPAQYLPLTSGNHTWGLKKGQVK